MEHYNITGLTAITVIVYLMASLIKAGITNKKVKKLIPSFCGIAGGIICVICFFTLEDIAPVDNWLSAFATGALCGLSATGINQVTKQLSNGKNDQTQNGDITNTTI